MFFSKKEKNDSESNLIKIGALLIHAAGIDENYSTEEEEIIKETLLNLGANKDNINSLIKEAKQCEKNANQILDFTKEIKNLPGTDKINIVKSLWRIIYSNKNADIYETNLMRRLVGLIYIDSKVMGNIKEEIKKEKIK